MIGMRPISSLSEHGAAVPEGTIETEIERLMSHNPLLSNMSRRVLVASVLGLFLISGLTMALPLANAQSTVAVSIPSGSGAGQSAAPGYSPDAVTLVIGVNNTVTWTNNDSAHHTVTSVSGNGSIGSGDLAPGATYSYTFTTPGTYQYHCMYHSWMTGTIVVKAGSAPPAGPMISMPSGAGSPNGAPGYSPDTITLVIGVNATVTWVNNDSAHHTVTSVSGNGSISSGDMGPGAMYTFTFTTPGTYQYYCVYHSWMTGTITVIKGP
jgi:plastocyanin